MQILEASVLALRSSRMVFRHHTSPVSVTLFPMVHVGEHSFYAEVFADAFGHDAVLVEGIDSPIARRLTRAYRWLDTRKLGLTLQPKPPEQEAIAARIVKADLSPKEFRIKWRKVSIIARSVIMLLVPLFGIYLRFSATREGLAQKMSTEDRRSSDEDFAWTPHLEDVYQSLVYARDERLVESLSAELEAGSERRIAVMYGAQHMRAVLKDLRRRGFYCVEARWCTVFAL